MPYNISLTWEYLISVSDEVSDKKDTISYTIINPSYDLKLELDDVM